MKRQTTLQFFGFPKRKSLEVNGGSASTSLESPTMMVTESNDDRASQQIDIGDTVHEDQIVNSDRPTSLESPGVVTKTNDEMSAELLEISNTGQGEQIGPNPNDVYALFPETDRRLIHQRNICHEKHCTDVSAGEHRRIHVQRNKETFRHSWLENRTTAFCNDSGVFWAIYVEGFGFYCFLCKKHSTSNQQNKEAKFNTQPCVRVKEQSLTSHIMSSAHRRAIEAELLNRVSFFQHQLDHIDKVRDNVFFNAFYAIYWLAKQSIANLKTNSLLQLLECLGCEIKSFQHRSAGSERGILQEIAQVILGDVLSEIRPCPTFGILVDDVTDIACIEQMIMFAQYYSRTTEAVKVKFLSVADVLADSVSADASTLMNVLLGELDRLNLDVKKIGGMASDGAAVMMGRNNGVAAKLKTLCPTVITVHCVCHRLALACADASEALKYFQTVFSYLTELWKLFEFSNQKTAVFVKTQCNMSQLSLLPQVKRKTAKKIKKACKTRWLSSDNSVRSAVQNYPAIIQTLLKLQDKCATSAGLLRHMNTPRFFCTLYILASVLPILAELSKTFQKSVVNFSLLGPCLESAKSELQKLVEAETPIRNLRSTLAESGNCLDFSVTQSDIEEMKTRLARYIDALIKNIDNRFQESLPVLGAFTVFNPLLTPSNGMVDYGVDEITKIATHFYPGDAGLQDRVMAEWGQLKYHLLEWKAKMPTEVKEGKKEQKGNRRKRRKKKWEAKKQEELDLHVPTPTEWALLRILKMRCAMGQLCPCLSFICEAVLSLPVSNAWPERAASKLKLTKTRLRSSMKNDLLNSLLVISLNGPPLFSKECDECIRKSVKQWLTLKKRRKVRTPGMSSAAVVLNDDTSEAIDTAAAEAAAEKLFALDYVDSDCESTESDEDKDSDFGEIDWAMAEP